MAMALGKLALWSLTATAIGLPLAGRADGPVAGPPGMARMVDSPALEAAFAHAQSGAVELAFRLSAEGRVEEVRVVGSEPPGVFDAAALGMLQGTRLAPPEDGTPEQEHHVIIHFRNDRDPRAEIDPAP